METEIENLETKEILPIKKMINLNTALNVKEFGKIVVE
tara:strand:+ start:459 stop:572 length:114 start_codon:yes stop_codon:yes gene_type:complete